MEWGEVTSGVPASVNDPNQPLRIGRRSDGAGATSYFDPTLMELSTRFVFQTSPDLMDGLELNITIREILSYS
jgi:hypothetical protein